MKPLLQSMNWGRRCARSFSSSRRNLIQNHYEVLGIKVNATADEIKNQFFKLSKLYHPDRNTDADPERYQQITQAYTVLSNDAERKKFDLSLGTAVRRPQGYHSGRNWHDHDNTRRRAGMSGYNYNPATRWQAANAHKMRKSSKLDPLRPQHGNSSVPHFDFAKHARSHERHDEYRKARQQWIRTSTPQPKTAATASMGDDKPSDPAAAGSTFMVKALGAATASVSLIWLLLR